MDLVAARSGFAEQMHVARLAVPFNGHHEVAIKLVRLEQVATDRRRTALLRWVARWLEKLSRNRAAAALRDARRVFTHDVLRRFDLRAEAANQSQTAHHFDGDARVVVPDVIWDLCSSATLSPSASARWPPTDLAGLAATA